MTSKIECCVRPEKEKGHIIVLFKPAAFSSLPSFAPMNPSLFTPSSAANQNNGPSTTEIMFQQILQALTKSVSSPVHGPPESLHSP
jgi:hypothetical protein